MQLQGITLYVDDLQKMVEFYRDVLGCIVEWDPRQRQAQIRHEGIEIVMQEREHLTHAFDGHESHRRNETFTLSLYLPYYADVQREYNWVIRAGGQPVQSPQAQLTYMFNAVLADPEGNLIQLTSDNQGLPEWEALQSASAQK